MSNAEWLDEHSLLRKCEDDLFRLALVKIEKKEAEKLQKESETGNKEFSAEDMEKMFGKSLARVKHTIQHELRKQHVMSFCKNIKGDDAENIGEIDHNSRKRSFGRIVHRTIPHIIKIAACLLLICYIGLTAAIAANSAVRIKVLNFIMNIEERYTSFRLEESDKMMEVPAEWEGYYYPSYIPDGMILSEVFPETVLYTHKDGRNLWFDDMSNGTQGTLDTEGAKIDFITINGHTALISEKGEWISLLWNIDNRMLMMSYSGDRAEAIKIAESIRMIK